MFMNEACFEFNLKSKSVAPAGFLCDMVRICAKIPFNLGFLIEF